MRVAIRADASAAIGIGHLMRALALAQALRDGGDDVTLVTATELGALSARWEHEGAEVRRLDAEIGSAADARATNEIAAEMDAAWLVVDGYAFDGEYRSGINGDHRLLLVDDHGAPGLRAGLVVNGNLYAGDAIYPSLDGRLLAGPSYALLRREFRASRGSSPRSGIVLSLGGADPDQRTAPLLEALAARDLRGQVVIGPRHRARDSLLALASDLGWTPLEAPEEMASLLAAAELAIVGSGTTTLECAALGVPMVAVPIADNQAPVATALAELGLALVADGDDPAGAADLAAGLAANPERRAAMAAAGPRIVDGRGALRVAGAMREALLALRPATRADARRLHEWRDDPGTRAASFTTEPVAWDDHLAWVDRVLASPNTRLLIGELEGNPVGVVRFDREGAAATISVTVAPAARSRGLAAPMIRAAVDAVDDLDLERVDAWVRPDNVASRRAFASAGFADVAREPGDRGRRHALRMVASASRRR